MVSNKSSTVNARSAFSVIDILFHDANYSMNHMFYQTVETVT